MRRLLYLYALSILQLALIVKLTPPLAHALRIEAAPGMAPEGWPAMLQLVATAAGRRRRRRWRSCFPGSRFRGTAGAAFCASPACRAGRSRSRSPEPRSSPPAPSRLRWFPRCLRTLRMTAVLIARPVVAGGLALAAAGVLCAELMRRSAGVALAARAGSHRRPGLVEVTHPPELRTRGT